MKGGAMFMLMGIVDMIIGEPGEEGDEPHNSLDRNKPDQQ
jgi:hypothetical protein